MISLGDEGIDCGDEHAERHGRRVSEKMGFGFLTRTPDGADGDLTSRGEADNGRTDGPVIGFLDVAIALATVVAMQPSLDVFCMPPFNFPLPAL
mmetsp:Transcript_15948/g.39462  ORF Transcript_15948/g.39462 Transcript_15948/m.39462 type:complete len:94 (+) Transcript_15948:1584-1865(+)